MWHRLALLERRGVLVPIRDGLLLGAARGSIPLVPMRRRVRRCKATAAVKRRTTRKEGVPLPAKVRLSLPVERISKLAPKHQQHGTAVGALIPQHVLVSLGVPEAKAARYA